MMLAFIFAFCATMGFCILFHVPKRHMLPAAFVGASGWLTFTFLSTSGTGKVVACFVASCLVGLLSDIFSRGFKEAATIFIIPGILPLVPGSGMYHTMMAILDGNIQETASVGTETLLVAGSIAVALLTVSSLIKVVVLTFRSITSALRVKNHKA